ncbi:hypothetical protein JL09_g4973 [Pichia kudriavzevii]|uniref:Uncharacterized protein n=1 Tax=Pichia kudriavzevii TaxID=4909 RepID=A0A099NVC7_PICKU|nr:hypothetical protein JL09_g4973 [Pichia kudriavzevii]
MASRRRAYPQPHYNPAAPLQEQPQLYSQQPQQQQFQQPLQQAPPQAPPQDQFVNQFSQLNINNQYQYHQQQQQQQQQHPQQQQPPFQHQTPFGYPPQPYNDQRIAPGMVPQQPVQPLQPLQPMVAEQSAPMNQLYSTDLLRDLPPPIIDLQFPPPPINLPPNSTLTDSLESNASSDYIRSTLNVVPRTNSILKKSKLPFALTIRPYQSLTDEESPIPIVNDGTRWIEMEM